MLKADAERNPDANAADLSFADGSVGLRHRTMGELRAAEFVLRTLQSPWLLKSGKLLARLGLGLRIPGTKLAIRNTVFRQFCGGTKIEEAVACAKRLAQANIGTILDYAVESGDSDAAFDEVQKQLLAAVHMAADLPEIPLCASKLTGLMPISVLQKKQANDELHKDDAAALQRGKARLDAVIRSAASHPDIGVFIDAEYSWVQEPIDAIAEELMARYNNERPVVFTTVQLYLRRGYKYLEGLIQKSKAQGFTLGVKLVRGAYLVQENQRAADLGVESPIQPSKEATDRAYDAALTLCLENLEHVAVCVATHNVPSTHHMISELERLGIARDNPNVTVAQLYGMLDRVTFPLAANGYRALKYLPYGPIRDSFPYLLRRADENKAVAEQSGEELKAVRAEMKRRRGRAT